MFEEEDEERGRKRQRIMEEERAAERTLLGQQWMGLLLGQL